LYVSAVNTNTLTAVESSSQALAIFVAAVARGAVEANKHVHVVFAGSVYRAVSPERLKRASNSDRPDSSCLRNAHAWELMTSTCVAGLLKFRNAACDWRNAISLLYHSNSSPCFPCVRMGQSRMHERKDDFACGSGGSSFPKKSPNSRFLPALTWAISLGSLWLVKYRNGCVSP